MTYEEFKKEVMENIKAYLPEDYGDATMSVDTITKSGIQYDGLVIKPIEQTTGCIPILNLNAAYEDYNKGKPIDAILQKLARTRLTAKNEMPFNKEDLLVFDKIKDMIVPRLVNTASNQEYLKNKPSITMEDLSIIFAVRVTQNDSLSDAVITYDLLTLWEVSLEDVHKQAIKNFETASVKFENLVDALLHRETPAIEDIDLDNYEIPVFILSNPQNTQGAGTVLNSTVMKKIIEKLGDVYILPSSVDEVLILPKNSGPALDDLIEMVTSVNVESVKPEDRLSNNIYEWDTETKMLRLAKV